MTCKLGDNLYLYEVKDNNVGLFFDAIHQLVGVRLFDCYKPIDQLDQVEKNLVETLKQVAYENMKDLQVDMSRFVQGQTSNDVHFSHQLVLNKDIPYNPSQVTSLPGSRITQLHIRNSGRTYFGPDASPAAVVHSNIQAGQVATQFGQNGQSERSHFSEEPYSRFSLDSLSSTDAVMDLMQPHFQLPSNSESFSDQPDLWFNGQAIIQSQQ